MKGPGGDKQDVICLDHAVLGRHRCSLDQRQQISLHPLTRNISPLHIGTTGYLIDFINKNEAILLDSLHSLKLDLFIIDQA